MTPKELLFAALDLLAETDPTHYKPPSGTLWHDGTGHPIGWEAAILALALGDPDPTDQS